MIIGIANYYDGLCSEKPYDVYSNVYAAMDFIVNVVKGVPGVKMLLTDWDKKTSRNSSFYFENSTICYKFNCVIENSTV